MKTRWIYVGFVISALMWGGARAQDTTDKTCQSAFEASPAGKSCEASLEKNWGKCSGMVQCGDEGPYHRLSGLSIDETERLIFCNEKAMRMKDAPDSCLTQQEQDTRRAEDAAAKAQKEACTEAWKQSSSAKTCTAE